MAQYGVIFDMDGVLIDSYQAHFESWRRMLSNHGREMTQQQFAETFGQTNRAIISRLFPDVTEQQFHAMADEKEQAFREVIHERLPQMPGTSELIRQLHQGGVRLAVGSSGPRANVEAVLQELPAGEYIDARVTGCDISQSKPDPEVFLMAAEQLGIPPRRCCVVEDAPAGLEAARRANMAAVALTGTADRQQLSDRADVVVDTLSQLDLQLIAELINHRLKHPEASTHEQ